VVVMIAEIAVFSVASPRAYSLKFFHNAPRNRIAIRPKMH